MNALRWPASLLRPGAWILGAAFASALPGWGETFDTAAAPIAAGPGSAGEGQVGPDAPVEVPALPDSYAPQIDAITLFPNPGEWPPSGFNDQRFGYLLHGSGRVSYESNVFLQPANAESDFIFRIAPAVAVGWGDFKAEVRRLSPAADLGERYLNKSFVFIDYRPSLTAFADHNGEDSVDHEAVLIGEWMWPRVSVGIRGRFRTENVPDEDLGTRTPQTRNSAAITTRYDFSGLMSLEVNGYLETRDYKGRGEDHQQWRNELWVNAQLRPALSLGGGLVGGYVARGGGPDERFEQALLRLHLRPTQAWAVALSVGPEFRQSTGGDDQTDGVFTASVGWTPVAGTHLSLLGYRRTVPSGWHAQNHTDSAVQGQWRQAFFEQCHFGLGGGLRQAEYASLGGGASTARTDDLWFLRASLGVAMTPWLNGELEGEYRSNESSDDAQSFEAVTLAVQFNVYF